MQDTIDWDLMQTWTVMCRLVFAWVALAMVLASVAGLLLHTRSVWAPALSDLFTSMRYGVSGRSRYAAHKDDADEMRLIRLEAGNGHAGGIGHAGVSDTQESRGNAPRIERSEQRDSQGSGVSAEADLVATFAVDEDAPGRGAASNKKFDEGSLKHVAIK